MALLRHTRAVVHTAGRANQKRPGHRSVCSGREDGRREEREERTAGESKE